MSDLDTLLRLPWARIPFAGQAVEVELDGAWADSLLVAACTGVDGGVSIVGHITPSGSMTYVVDGVIKARVRYNCVRCLEERIMALKGGFTHTFRPRDKAIRGEDGEEQWEGGGSGGGECSRGHQ